MLTDPEALALAEAPPSALPELMARAAEARDAAYGRTLTFSPKVFLPVTNLCRNRCDYCSFRRSPGEAGEWTMAPAEVDDWLARGQRHGCAEALLCLGDRPETASAGYRRLLGSFGHESTVSYLVQVGGSALARGLLPHTNAGVLSAGDMARLRAVNASLGLMLESASERLCGPGMPHHRAPDKRPARRLRMLREAGELRIPFTSGILLGIGETPRERVEALLWLRRLHQEHGHLQEVIVQNFEPRPEIRMADAPPVEDHALLLALALARLILPPEVSLQAPPNLNPGRLEALVAAGINDFGGISPVTPDYVNHHHPWPSLAALETRVGALGFSLRPRPCVYPRYVEERGWLDEAVREAVAAVSARLARAPSAAALAEA